MTLSRSIHVIANGIISFFLMALGNIPLYISIHHNFFIHSSVGGHLGCFHVLAIVNSPTMNTVVRVSFQIMFFSRYMPRSGTAGSHGSSIFIFFFFLNFTNCISFAKYKNESATGIHVFPILNPPPSSLPIPSLWVITVHQPQASSIVHQTWTGDSFHT